MLGGTIASVLAYVVIVVAFLGYALSAGADEQGAMTETGQVIATLLLGFLACAAGGATAVAMTPVRPVLVCHLVGMFLWGISMAAGIGVGISALHCFAAIAGGMLLVVLRGDRTAEPRTAAGTQADVDSLQSE